MSGNHSILMPVLTVPLVTKILAKLLHVLTWKIYWLIPFVSVVAFQRRLTVPVLSGVQLAGETKVTVVGGVVSVVKFRIVLRDQVIHALLYDKTLR